MKKVEVRKVFVGLVVVSLMCIAPGFGLRAQDNSTGEKTLTIYSERNKYGFKDEAGNIVVVAKYSDVTKFHEGYAAVNIGGKSQKVKMQYEVGVRNDLAMYNEFILGGKWGFIDVNGNEVVPCKYAYTGYFHNGLAAVNTGGKTVVVNNSRYVKGGKWGYIDATGREVIPGKYNDAGAFNYNRAWVKLNKSYGYIDKTGNAVTPLKYDDAKSFSDGLAHVILKGKHGFIDITGNEIVPCKYSDIKNFSDGLAQVTYNGKYGFIDKTGNEIIPCTYDFARSFSDGLAAVNIGGKWTEIDPVFKQVFKGLDNYISFEGGKWGFIDTGGKVVIQLQYDHAESFKDGKATVKLNNITEEINKPEISGNN
jgi:hypothetical protein